MSSEVDVYLSVRVSRLKPWERLFVVGSLECVGSWRPQAALHMERKPTDRDVWEATIKCPADLTDFSFRYFIGYFLEPAIEDQPPSPVLLIHKWECALSPRVIHPNLLRTQNGTVRRETEDLFGSYDGRKLISDGFLIHKEEHAIFLRIHGQALKFYTPKEQAKTYRLKIVPFDIRFREAYSYEERHTRMGMLWRSNSVYKQSVQSQGSVDEERPSTPEPALPALPSFSNTELSVLTRDDPLYGEQYPNGSVFRNSIDYLVFRTRTVALEQLGFRLELYTEEKDQKKSERIGMAYALPAALPDTYGKTIIPILSSPSQRPIGQITVDYMLAKSLKTDDAYRRDNIQNTFCRHWTKRKTLEVGHRGCGSSFTKEASSRENTLHSLQAAGKKGADMVEFDVQLTKDMRTVIYHDFHVCVEVAGRNDSSQQLHTLAVKDLKLRQLHLLRFEHLSVASNPPTTPQKSSLRLTPQTPDEDKSSSPFPTLVEALRSVDEHVGFNIEVKYPMLMKDGTHECVGYFERNVFVDILINEVLEYGGQRRILFSSFDPDICTMLSIKQHRYPCLFLVVGTTTRYEPFEDIRSDCSVLASNFAAGCGLLGVNFHSEELLKNPLPFRRAQKFNLVTFVWGDDLNARKVQEYFKNELHVDGLIYDRIGEEEVRQNVFLVEGEKKAALFSRSTGVSPANSRRSSIERDTAQTLSAVANELTIGNSKSPPAPKLKERAATLYTKTKSNSNF